MNLAFFYLRFSEAALKCDIVGKEDNYKYLVALYTHHFRERSTFSVFFFFLAILFLGNLRQDAQVFIPTRPLRVNMITWNSKKNQLCVVVLKCRCIFILYFHIQIFFRFNFPYVAKLFYLKIGKPSNSIIIIIIIVMVY